jgi:hypothetical protein
MLCDRRQRPLSTEGVCSRDMGRGNSREGGGACSATGAGSAHPRGHSRVRVGHRHVRARHTQVRVGHTQVRVGHTQLRVGGG